VAAASAAPPDPGARRLPWLVATLAATADETDRARTLFFDVPGWPGHRPGQHVDVRLTAEDGYQAQRSYSIASPPEAPRLALTIERLPDGEVSPYLTEVLRPGDPIELRGPIGGYFTWTTADGGPLILVAGGSGVAPLMAMLRHRAAALARPAADPVALGAALAAAPGPGAGTGSGAATGAPAPATLLYSSRSWDEVIFRDELAAMAAADPTLRVVHTLTRAQPPGWEGYHRRIDPAMLAEVAGPPRPGAIAFACGPTPFVERAATGLVDLGYPADRVRTERFGPSGV
jgi:ferredoxin-NADP reductase